MIRQLGVVLQVGSFSFDIDLSEFKLNFAKSLAKLRVSVNSEPASIGNNVKMCSLNGRNDNGD